MLTSFLRHHTVLHHPLIGMEWDGEVLNWRGLIEQARSFAENAVELTAGRLIMAEAEVGLHTYNPVGYVISSEKKVEDVESGRAKVAEDLRRAAWAERAEQRIVSRKTGSG